MSLLARIRPREGSARRHWVFNLFAPKKEWARPKPTKKTLAPIEQIELRETVGTMIVMAPVSLPHLSEPLHDPDSTAHMVRIAPAQPEATSSSLLVMDGRGRPAFASTSVVAGAHAQASAGVAHPHQATAPPAPLPADSFGFENAEDLFGLKPR